MNKLVFSSIFFLFFFINSISAQKNRAIAILDMTVRNAESNDARFFSVLHLVKVAGVPYVVTTDVVEASAYEMIMCSSLIDEWSFSASEQTALVNFVEEGGLLFAPRVQDPDFFPLFGIDSYTDANNRYDLHWDATNPHSALRYIDQAEEWTLSLGRSSYSSIFKTLGYQASTAKALAHFSDGSIAVSQNSYGQGQALAIGISWKEVILRNQINRDYEAQRISSNGFEPTSDVFALFVRALFLDHVPYAVWKNTSPGNSQATVMITHDLDSSTAMDTLRGFVDYQYEHDLEATYNVTVRYFSDALNSAFYLNRQEVLDYIKSHGQAFGSHSVGHFFDFAEEDVFPLGSMGNTRDSYQPYNDGSVTTGGSIYGECEVSKDILEEDIAIDIRVFRSGHLAFPKYLIDALDTLGYQYNSSCSASDVLTHFPFQSKTGRSFSGNTSNVYELPVSISDVFHDDPISSDNYLDKADIWLEVTEKNRQNGAPSVLLIHPNRNYKISGMEYYLEQLPADIHFMEMSKYGDFWKAREQFDFVSSIDQGNLVIELAADADLSQDISIIVDKGQGLSNIRVNDAQGNLLNFHQEYWGEKDILLQISGILTADLNVAEQNLKLEVFPNPLNDQLSVAFEWPQSEQVKVQLYNLQGVKIRTLFDQAAQAGKNNWSKNISTDSWSPGIYFIQLSTDKGLIARKKILITP